MIYDILVIIPAKLDSTRLQYKNIQEVDGMSLVEHSIKYALASKHNISIVVSTDNVEKMKEVLGDYIGNGVELHDRRGEFVGNAEVAFVYEEVTREYHTTHHYVVGLQPDQLNRSLPLDDMLEYMISSGYDELITVSPDYKRSGSVRIFYPFNLLATQYSLKIGTIMDAAINIHTEDDLNLAKRVIKQTLPITQLDFAAIEKSSHNRHNSQYGETGVMDYFFGLLGIEPKFAVEFGAGSVSKRNGTANIRYFNDKYGCECLYFEIQPNKIRSSDPEYRHQIKIEAITKSNVNEIFKKYNVPDDVDVVVIDVDGQDYWIWKALEYSPKFVLIEFNPSLEHDFNVVMHDDEEHYKWRDTTCLYYGANIGAMQKLGNELGYSLVYKSGRNLLFIRRDLVDVHIPTKLFHPEPTKDFRSTYKNETNWVYIP